MRRARGRRHAGARRRPLAVALDGVRGHTAELTDEAQVAGAIAAAEAAFGGSTWSSTAPGAAAAAPATGPSTRAPRGLGRDPRGEPHERLPLLQARGARAARAGGGAIVNLSSALGLVGGDADFATHAYAASKGAIVALTRAMAVTYAPEGIRCNVVCPGLIATPMSARAQDDPAIRARLAELQPLTGGLRAPEDVAGRARYLAVPARAS